MLAESRVSRRWFLQFASAAGLGLAASAILSACAPKPQPTQAPPKEEKPAAEQPTAPPAEAKPAPKEDIVLRLHLRAGGEKSEEALYVTCPGLLTEAYPHIKVELEPIPGGEFEAKVQTMAAAKTLGDVMWTAAHSGYHMRLTRLGVILESDDQLEANGLSKDEWVPAAVGQLTYEGKMYGMPKNCHPGAAHIWINEEMFEEAGLPIPETYNHTHAEVTEWAKAIAKGPENDREVYGYVFNAGNWEWLYSQMRSFGGWEYNEQGTESGADSTEWYEWATWAEAMFRTGLAPRVETLPTGGLPALLAARKVPMLEGPRGLYAQIKAAIESSEKPFRWRVIQAAREANANGWLGIIATHSATTSSKHPAEAFLLSYYMANKACAELQMKSLGYLTARADDLETVEKLNDPFLKLQYENARLQVTYRLPENTRESESRTVLQNEMQKIFLGDVKLTPDAMKQVKTAIDDVLAKPF